MSRDKQIEGIIESFKTGAEDFKARNNAVSIEISFVYKDEDRPQNGVNYCYAKIYFNTFIVVFKYSAHGAFTQINSIIDCFICFEKTETPLLYPMYNIMNLIEDSNFECLTIANISSASFMNEAMDAISGAVEKHLNKIEEISFDYDLKRTLFQDLLQEMSDFLGSTITYENHQDFMDYYYYVLSMRFTANAYIFFLTGNYKKAAKRYSKISHKTIYEKRLAEEIEKRKSGKSQYIDPLSIKMQKIYKSDYNRWGFPKSDVRELFAILALWIPLNLIWAIPIGIAYYILISLEKSDSFYMLNEFSSLGIPVLTMAIISSYFFGERAYKFLFPKNYAKRVALDNLVNQPKFDKFMKKFAFLLLVCMSVFIILVSKSNITFKSEGFFDNRDLWTTSGPYYPYTDIEKVSYVGYEKNDFGYRVYTNSYSIILQDGGKIDLSIYEEAPQSDKKLIPFLKSKGVKIVR